MRWQTESSRPLSRVGVAAALDRHENGRDRLFASNAIAVAIEMTRVARRAAPYRCRAGSTRGGAIGIADAAAAESLRLLGARRRPTGCAVAMPCPRAAILMAAVGGEAAAMRLKRGGQCKQRGTRPEYSHIPSPNRSMVLMPIDVDVLPVRHGGFRKL